MYGKKRAYSGRVPLSDYRPKRYRTEQPEQPIPVAAPYRQMRYQRPGLTEVKCCDMVLAAAANLGLLAAVAGTEPAAAYTGLTEVNLIGQGATVAQRIGNKVVMKSIQCTVQLGVIAAANSGSIRCMLVYDKQPNGAFPAITDVILDQPLGAATPLSGINIANKSRFQMIRDEYLALDSGMGLTKVLTWYCKGRWEVEFGANGGNIGDFRTGACYFICYYVTAIVAPPQIQYLHTRIRYFD